MLYRGPPVYLFYRGQVLPASSLKNLVYVEFIYENVKYSLEVSQLTSEEEIRCVFDEI